MRMTYPCGTGLSAGSKANARFLSKSSRTCAWEWSSGKLIASGRDRIAPHVLGLSKHGYKEG